MGQVESFINSIIKMIVNIYKDISEVLREQSGWIVLFLGIAAGFLIGIVILFLKVKVINKGQSNLINNTVSGILNEKSKSEAILNDLDVGILAYASNGDLINSNPAFLKIMQTENPPTTYRNFLMEYGRENGLVAGSMLGTEISEGIYSFDEKIVRIKIKEAQFTNDIKSAKIIVIQDITEQEREEKRRKDFVANVSHELKTPLTTIKTYSESLIDWGLKEKNKESIKKDVIRIHDDAVRMGTLVEDLLLLSSIDSKEMRPNMDQYDFSEIVKSIVDRMQIQAKEKNIELTCYTMGHLPPIFIHRTSIERIIINILSNAIKYTDTKGKVTVYLGVLVDDVYAKISDTGFGIEKDNLENIFRRFYRVDMTGSRMYGGTGLGLSIAKELAHLHGGDITVNSVLGKGSDFVIKIPFAAKVFEDCFDSNNITTDSNDVLYKMAGEYLNKIRNELKIKTTQLNNLTIEQKEKIINKALVLED